MNLSSHIIRHDPEHALWQGQAQPIDSGIVTITDAAQFALRPIRRLPRITSAELFHQSSEFHQVRHPEERSLPAHDELRILGKKVRPLGRNRANGLVIHLQQKTPARAVIPLAHAGELLPAEGMERMSHSHKARRCEGSVCIQD